MLHTILERFFKALIILITMAYTILDCYTDEPAGLGVPPYLGTYPRYIAGYFGKVNYITIDDLRFLNYYNLAYS